MLHHHGVLAHDGQSIDGQPFVAGDTITIDDDGDQGALIVTNHRTHGQMLVSLTSACWIPSYAQSRTGDTILWTPYGEPHPSEGVAQTMTGTGRKAIQVYFGSALEVRRALMSDDDLLHLARPLSPDQQNSFFWQQWRKMNSLRRPLDQDDSSDGGLSTGCSSPSSIPSPVTPMNFARHDAVVDPGSLDRLGGNEEPGIVETDAFCSDQLPASSPLQRVPVSPTAQFSGSNIYSKVVAPLQGNTKYPDISTSNPQLLGMQAGCNPHYGFYPYGWLSQPDLLGCMATNNVQVNYMCVPTQEQQHQTRAPTNEDSSPRHDNPQWNPSLQASSAEWQAAYSPQGFAPMAGSGHPEQLGLVHQSPGPVSMREAYHPPQPLVLSNPSRQLAPGQMSLTNPRMTVVQMPGTESPFVRHLEQQELNLTAGACHYYGPPLHSVESKSSRSHAASNASREPEPQPTSEFRPDLVLNSFQHQIQPDIAVLQRAARGDVDGRPASTLVTEALQLVQSKADETIGILESLRPGAEYAGVECQKSIRNTVNHILAGIQAVRQSAMDGREPAEDDRKELSKHVESLKALVGRMADLKADVLRDAPRKKSGSQASGAAPGSDMSRTGATVAHPTAATMALSSFNWGQTTPPPDQPPRMVIGHGHPPAPFLHGMPSHATNMHQAALLSPPAPLSGFDPSGCSVDPALSGVAHSGMALGMPPSTGPGPVTAGGWVPYPAVHPAVSASSDTTFPPHQRLPTGLVPAIYPSPPQPAYGETLASMYEATHGPLPSHLAMHSPTASSPVQVSNTGVSSAAPGPLMAHASSFANPVPGLGPSTGVQFFPGHISMAPSVTPSSAAQDNHVLPTPSPVAAGRRGSVPDRRLPFRERSRIAPYPADYRSSSGRKGSV